MIQELAPCCGQKAEDIKTKIVHKRAGEKHHEELMTEDEARNAFEVEGMFVIAPPSAVKSQGKTAAKKTYVSCDGPLLTKREIKKLLFESSSA